MKWSASAAENSINSLLVSVNRGHHGGGQVAWHESVHDMESVSQWRAGARLKGVKLTHFVADCVPPLNQPFSAALPCRLSDVDLFRVGTSTARRRVGASIWRRRWESVGRPPSVTHDPSSRHGAPRVKPDDGLGRWWDWRTNNAQPLYLNCLTSAAPKQIDSHLLASDGSEHFTKFNDTRQWTHVSLCPKTQFCRVLFFEWLWTKTFWNILLSTINVPSFRIWNTLILHVHVFVLSCHFRYSRLRCIFVKA